MSWVVPSPPSSLAMSWTSSRAPSRRFRPSWGLAHCDICPVSCLSISVNCISRISQSWQCMAGCKLPCKLPSTSILRFCNLRLRIRSLHSAACATPWEVCDAVSRCLKTRKAHKLHINTVNTPNKLSDWIPHPSFTTWNVIGSTTHGMASVHKFGLKADENAPKFWEISRNVGSARLYP